MCGSTASIGSEIGNLFQYTDMLSVVMLTLALLFQIQASADQTVFFEERVRPLLAARCHGCHGDTKVSRLGLDSREGMLAGGRRGSAILPGDAAASLLVKAIERAGDLKMPPEGKLPDADIATLKQWIAAGAPWPAAKHAAPAVSTGKITTKDREWWAFRPLARPAPGASIDALIAAQQSENGVTPVARADGRTLIRRLTFDLTGLPPAPEEAARFLRDGDVGAAVDRLLATPRFGERWGRYWLDIARYGEDDFRGLDQEKYPNAWRYRDWVIEAFNRDLPYSTFIKAQLAADLMEADAGFDLRPALGFLGLGPWHYGITPPPQARADERHDRVDAVARGFLGLTVACARCHDHKFDPITTRDYYGLAGVFASTGYQEFPLTGAEAVDQYTTHQKKIKEAEKRVSEFLSTQRQQLADMLAQQSALYLAAVTKGQRGDLNWQIYDRWQALLNPPRREHTLFDGWQADGAPTTLQALIDSVIAEKKEIDEEKRLALERSKPTRGAMTRLPNGFETYDDYCPGCDASVSRTQPRDRYKLWEDLFRDPPKDKPNSGGVYAFDDADLEAQLSTEWKRHLAFLRAEVERLKKAAPPPYPFLHAASEREDAKNLKINIKGDPYRLGEEAPRRFLEVLSPSPVPIWTSGSGRQELAAAIVAQPITARVAANRIWMKLTGRAIAGSPSNFGRFGERPSHPDLLEYLAARFTAQGWSVKKLIREIVLSETYQRASAAHAANENIDAANKWYWRGNRERLDAEALRDSLLCVSGVLDPAVGGPSEELDAATRRRTVYGRISRFKLNEMLQLFDFPNPSITSEKRNVTHVPLQRLFFLNNEFVARQASALAARVEADANPIRQAYALLFQREPTPGEARMSQDFLRTAGWKQLAQVLLSSNEFLFVD